MKYAPAKHFTKAERSTVDLVVIHTAECGETSSAAENLSTWIAGPNASQASWHYAVDNDSVTQSVLEKDVAWHAGPVNGFSIGIEHAGFAKQTAAEWDDAYSIDVLARSAELVADICTRHGIPVERLSAADLKAGKRKGICGHVDVTDGLTGGRGHYDPGPNFPWAEYLDMVRANMATPSAAADTRATAQGLVDGGLVRVEHDGVTWEVCPVYVAPVGIAEAARVAAELGFELPSAELVDAIWRAADMKIDGWAVAGAAAGHDGTPATMNTDAMHLKVQAKIASLIDRPYRLLAGAFKDIVRKDGAVGLYGWHDANGRPIQGFYAGHAGAWKDYSQGLRLCRRA